MNAPSSSTEPVIDFVAYHDLQAQCGLSAYEALSKYIKCNWRIGPHSTPSPNAIAAVMLDHSDFQKHVHKQPGGYRHLFQMSHDLGDLLVYREEAFHLCQYDAVFTPTALHSAIAHKIYDGITDTHIIEAGWAKYDLMSSDDSRNQFAKTLKDLPCPTTILYAPTYAKNYEWKDLFPALLAYPNVNVVIKNHIYINPGQALPEKHEDEYTRELQSADEMEAAVHTMNDPRLIIAPRTLNICSLFPYVNLLISDCSSVLAEYLPFGNSIETGRCGPGMTAEDNKREMGKMFNAINYIPTPNLITMLSEQKLGDLLKPIAPGQNDGYGLKRPAVGEFIANNIATILGLKARAA